MIKRMSKFTALLLSALMILSVIATGLTSAVAAEVILCVQSKQFFSLLLIDNLHYIQEDERKNVVSHLIFLHRQRELKEPAVYRFDFRVMGGAGKTDIAHHSRDLTSARVAPPRCPILL